LPDVPETTATPGDAVSPAVLAGSVLDTTVPGRTSPADVRPVRGGGLRGWRTRHPLASFVVQRVLVALLMLWVVSVLIFLTTSLVPADPVGRILGKYATPESMAALRSQLGLDMPPVQRYLHWLGGMLHGDMGISLTPTRTPVKELVSQRLGNTLILAAIAMACLVPLSLGLGVWAGLRADRRADKVISGVTLGFIAVPDFVVGAVLTLVLAAWLDLLPPVSLIAPGTSPLADPSLLVLTIVTLLISLLAPAVRMVRSGMIEVMSSEYVELARLNGVPERRVVLRHALRNALAPSVQVLALLLQYMIGGLIVIETLFNYPGIGFGLVEAVTSSDYTYVQSIATLLAAIYMAVYIAADLLFVLLVPRLRTGRAR